MIWWDFSNSPFIAFFAIFVSSFVLLILLILTFTLSNVKMTNTVTSISQESKTVRVYIIDLKNNNVTYFTRSDIKNKQKIVK